jgi:hypothetical protein
MKYDSDIFQSHQNPGFGFKNGYVDITPGQVKLL